MGHRSTSIVQQPIDQLFLCKYVNVNSPVGSEYKIFIPATVNYGWGTATSQLTILVKPVK